MNDLDDVLKKDYRVKIDKKIVYYVTEYLYRVLIIQKFILIPLANKTKITPNQITLIGFALVLLSFLFIYLHHYTLAGVLYLAYNFLDHIDGMLARYKKMFSKIGHKLDSFVDGIAFNFVFVVVYCSCDVSIYCVVFVMFMLNLYAFVATKYIVPKLKTLDEVRRFGIKKWFFDRGFILGIDTSLYGMLIFLMLFSEKFELFMVLIGLIYLLDLLYRLHELKINIIIQEFKNEKQQDR